MNLHRKTNLDLHTSNVNSTVVAVSCDAIYYRAVCCVISIAKIVGGTYALV
jgi:hypothetical protein